MQEDIEETTVRISCAVMAHPSRQGSAKKLASNLARFGARVVYDPDPDGPPSSLSTAKKAWESYSPGATHHLVIQDDVVIPGGFCEELEYVVGLKPDRTFNLWNEWTSRSGQAIRIATYVGASWAPVVDETVVAVAAIMPISMVPDFLKYIPYHPDDRDSRALYEFLRREGHYALTTAPCLVQHDEPMTQSLWRRNLGTGPRRAASYLHELRKMSKSRNSETVEFQSLPYIPHHLLTATVAVPRSDMNTFDMLDGLEALPTLQESHESISGRFYDEMIPKTRELQEVVAVAHLFHVWLTAVLTGYEIFGSYGRAPNVDTAEAKASSQSLFLGSLKRTHSIELLELLKDHDSDWIEDGIQLGSRIATTRYVRHGRVPRLGPS